MNFFKINRAGIPIVAICISLMFVFLLLISIFSLIGKIGFILFFLLSVTMLFFFRDPERQIPNGKGIIVSPADGKVVEMSKEYEGLFCKKEMIRISIFLSILDVHVNRMPVSGKVIFIKHNPGKYFCAASHKASLDNEQTILGVETTDGMTILVKQIAGLDFYFRY